MKQLYLFLFFFPTLVFAQINEGLTTEERAYLFHIVKKSPILDNLIGRYFDYQGPDIRFPNKEINYDSVELIIINQPEILVIRKEEIAKSPKGIISEAANKMAIWELNKVLLAKRGSEKELEPYDTIVIDTAETCLEYIRIYIENQDYKLKSNPLRMYGKLKDEFFSFLNRIIKINKNVILSLT